MIRRRLVAIATMLTNPGSGRPGLRKAWAGDLNRDGRVEVAVRNFITPSVGEVLVVHRQKRRRSLSFEKLQTITGDQVKLVRPRGRRAVVTVLVKSTHAPDNRVHDEVWRWSQRRDRWTCRNDCVARAGG